MLVCPRRSLLLSLCSEKESNSQFTRAQSVIQLVSSHATCNHCSVRSAFGDRWLLIHGILYRKDTKLWQDPPHLYFGFCFFVFVLLLFFMSLCFLFAILEIKHIALLRFLLLKLHPQHPHILFFTFKSRVSTFSLKEQNNRYFRFKGHIVPVTTTVAETGRLFSLVVGASLWS